MATKTHLVVDQGTTFTTVLNLTDTYGDPLDLSIYDVSATFKKWYTSTDYTPFQASANLESGSIILKLDPEDTYPLEPGRYVYDVNLTNINNNSVSRVVEGILTLTPQCTRY